jgi:hypothetical protein
VLTRTIGNQGNEEVMLLSTDERVGVVGCSGSRLPVVTSRDGWEVLTAVLKVRGEVQC